MGKNIKRQCRIIGLLIAAVISEVSSGLNPTTNDSVGKKQKVVYLAENILKCNEVNYKKHDNSDYEFCEINTELTILNHCITFDKSTNSTEIGSCIYVASKILHEKEMSNVLRLADSICGKFKRNGILCGKCQEGYSPLAYSYDMKCVQCPHGASNWWKYLLAAFLPLTVFYFIIILMKINITSSYLHGYVLYAQIISAPGITREILIVTSEYNVSYAKWVGSLYQIWNLDFFRLVIPGNCLGTDTVLTLALDYTIGIYPLSLLVLSYVLIHLYDIHFKPLVWIWKPFRAVFSLFNSKWEIKTSLIDAFSTLLLLAYVKTLNTSFDLLIPVNVYQLSSSGQLTRSWRLYIDATLVYFGPRHLPYAILAIVMLLIFMILPMLLLFLYPFCWFQKFLNLFPFRWYVLHTFVDSFQGCYKDGTEPGTRDCRWFASLFLTLRLVTFLIGAYTKNILFFPLSTITLVFLCILIISIQPFKEPLRHHSYINAMFLLLLAVWNTTVVPEVAAEQYNLSAKIFLIFLFIIGSTGFFYMSGIILLWMYKKRRFGREFIQRLQSWRQGYQLLQ